MLEIAGGILLALLALAFLPLLVRVAIFVVAMAVMSAGYFGIIWLLFSP